METVHTIGRRKTAVARVFVKEGKGDITINKRTLDDYFPLPMFQVKVKQPLTLTETLNLFDIKITVKGGGVKGQAEAIRLGIARALSEIDPEYRSVLKPAGLLTRDPRMVERKKFGQKKARKKFQFSKR